MHPPKILYPLIGLGVPLLIVILLITLKPFSSLNGDKPTHLFKPTSISPDILPITFEVPVGYGVFHTASLHPVYVGTIYIGEEVNPRYFTPNITMRIVSRNAIDPNTGENLQKFRSLSEYIDTVYEEQKKDLASEVTSLELFGNKAVQYTSAFDGTINMVGYLRTDQTNGQLGNEEMLVEISGLPSVASELTKIFLSSFKTR